MPVLTRAVFANGKNQTLTVTVTGDFGYSDIDERIIVETAAGITPLHQSNKVQGAPTGMIGYIHNYSENTLWAVTALDTQAHTITIVKEGQAKNNVHRF